MAGAGACTGAEGEERKRPEGGPGRAGPEPLEVRDTPQELADVILELVELGIKIFFVKIWFLFFEK